MRLQITIGTLSVSNTRCPSWSGRNGSVEERSPKGLILLLCGNEVIVPRGYYGLNPRTVLT